MWEYLDVDGATKHGLGQNLDTVNLCCVVFITFLYQDD